MRSILVIPLLIALPLAARAETAFVTDNLRLGLHRAADTSDRAFRTLESGQQVEVLAQDRYYAHVRLPDGAVGYLKAAYLVNEKPAKLIVAEARAQADRLEQELATLREQFAGPAATIGALEAQVAEQKAAIEKNLARVAELLDSNQSYAARAEQYQYSLPMSWVGAALGVSLFAGFMLGWWWLDYRSRKRHGGMRIY
ncbi:MAG TPA: TIGR04211 family SH3 domain-containing protein [Woeseiaceae bacterium]|nr:TIGR04211 family SH3 domain-containing protein [Woeseiaceae bacterium]